jgi:predicted aconitase with swiveling domain
VAEVRALVPGQAEGPALVLEEPLSFWGGLDPETGLLIDVRHPQAGASLRGCVLVLPSGRGSSSSASVLAEAIRLGTAPAAIVLGSVDPIVALGALVAAELYGTHMPVVVAQGSTFAALRTGIRLGIHAGAAAASLAVAPG